MEKKIKSDCCGDGKCCDGKGDYACGAGCGDGCSCGSNGGCSCGSTGCCGGHRKIFHCIFKLVLILVVLGLVFCAGAKCGMYKYGRFAEKALPQAGQQAVVQSKYLPMMYEKGGWFGEKKEMLFGVIAKIDGNKITITDNAAKAEILTTEAKTTIISAAGAPLGLSGLKVGQNILFSAEKAKDDTTPQVVKTIQVL